MIEPASAILLYSWILLPMPPNASPGLSMGYFGTAWATCMISKCCHYKMAGLNLSTHHEVGDWASICHPFAFLDASPGLSMGHFGIMCVATCMISKCCHYKMAGLNLSTHHKIGDWASICHPFVFLDFASNASKCKPWPLNELFWNSVGYLYDFQVLPL